MEPWVQVLVQVLAPGGIAAIAVKAVLNGTKERVKEIHEDVKGLKENVIEVRDYHHLLTARMYILEEKARSGDS